MMKDYLIVGLGIAGINLAYHLEKRGREFTVIDEGTKNATRVAGGLINPIVLKRYTMAWGGHQMLSKAYLVYSEMQSMLKTEFLHPTIIYRRLNTAEEQNDWITASDRPLLDQYLDPKIRTALNPHIREEYGYGRLQGVARIDTKSLLDSYCSYLFEKRVLVRRKFDYEKLVIEKDRVTYGDLEARRIIFCEGIGLLENPYFNYLPLRPNKGEYLYVRIPGLDLKETLKASVFISPLGQDIYAVGATYDSSDSSASPSLAAREELSLKLKKITNLRFEILDQVAGVRPTTSDRRPMLGQHPRHPSLYCCNGYGSRGLLMSPSLSEDLLDYIETGKKIDPQMDVERFRNKHFTL